jgi:chromosome segregation ATPase
MAELTLETLRAELAPLRADLAVVKDSLPLTSRSLTTLRQEVRSLRGAFNDFAHESVTAGEIEALHTDVNSVQTRQDELETRIVTLERLVRDFQENGGRQPG